MKKSTLTIFGALLFVVILMAILFLPKSGTTPQIQPVVSDPVVKSEAQTTPLPDRVIARINGEPVMSSEIEEKIDGFTGKFKEINPNMKFPEDRLAKMRKDFLDRLIKEKILELAARKSNIQASDDEIDKRIEQFQKIFGEGEEAKKRFLDGIKDMGKFRKEVAKQIMIDKYMDQNVEGKIEVTEEEIKEYYTNNTKLFETQDEAKVQHILWKLPSKETEQDAYKEKIEKAKESAKEVIANLKKGGDFADLAKKHSEDVTTASKGGDLGWIKKGKMVKPFEDVAFSLKPGEISEPVETNFGIHVIQTLEIKTAHTLSIDESREKIKTSIEGRKKQQKRDERYELLKKETKVEYLE